MLIENKIWHHENNPFESYDRFSEKLISQRQCFKVILAPGGKGEPHGWRRLTYRDLLEEIEPRLDKWADDYETNKWWYFAKDFTLHLRNIMYTQSMSDETIKIAEAHFPQIQKAIEIHQHYRGFLKAEMYDIVSRCIGHSDITVKDEGWAIRAYFPAWNNASVAWGINGDGPELRMYLVIYFQNIEPEKREKAANFAKKQNMDELKDQTSGNAAWESHEFYCGRKLSEDSLRDCATFIASLYS